VYAYGASAFRASPPCFFFLQEFSDPRLFDVFEVLYHAHMVLQTISFIQALQPIAWGIYALGAEFFFFASDFAGLYPALNSGDGLVFVRFSAAWALVLLSQISEAGAAVHSAGCDERTFV
jgi:hypothetical protein